MNVDKVPQIQPPQAQSLPQQLPQQQPPSGLAQVARSSPRTAQLAHYAAIANGGAPIQRQAVSQGGLPGNLKSGIESLSGIGMDDVRVHYNSAKPAQLQAHAYAQGADIHIAPGQEKHLPHEAWHVVQQKQGRVKPTLQLKGIAINDDSALEREADVMGDKASQMGGNAVVLHSPSPRQFSSTRNQPIQGRWVTDQVTVEHESPWTYFSLNEYYYNAERNAHYYYKTRFMDLRDEPGGAYEVSDAEHQAIMAEVEAIETRTVYVEDTDNLVLDLVDMTLSPVDDLDAAAPIGGKSLYTTLLQVQADGIDVSRYLPAAKEENHSIPARQLSVNAAVGFEFQSLTSKVRVFKKPEVREVNADDAYEFDDGGVEENAYQAALAGATAIPTQYFGADRLWFIVADGDNLEFVTTPFKSAADLRAGMAELERVATRLSTAAPNSKWLVGDTVVIVEVPGTTAQPQANPDIPLAALHEFVQDVMDDAEMFGDMFGANGALHWQIDRTFAEMTMIAEATAAIMDIPDATLSGQLGIAIANAEGHNKLDNARGMLQLIAHATIHKLHFPTEMPKDQPLLSKVHLGRVWAEVMPKGMDSKIVMGLLREVYPQLATDQGKELRKVVGAIANGKDPVWASETAPKAIGQGRQQIFIELRRAPVLPIQDWLGFAMGTYRYFAANAIDNEE